jgi:hypothetical protein
MYALISHSMAYRHLHAIMALRWLLSTYNHGALAVAAGSDINNNNNTAACDKKSGKGGTLIMYLDPLQASNPAQAVTTQTWFFRQDQREIALPTVRWQCYLTLVLQLAFILLRRRILCHPSYRLEVDRLS